MSSAWITQLFKMSTNSFLFHCLFLSARFQAENNSQPGRSYLDPILMTLDKHNAVCIADLCYIFNPI